MNFLERTPFLRLLIPLIAGIVVAGLLSVSCLISALVLLLALLLMLVSRLVSKGRMSYSLRWLWGVGLHAILFFAGYFLHKKALSDSAFPKVGQTVFCAELAGTPVEKANSVMCVLSVLFARDASGSEVIRKKALVYLQKDSASLCLERGDALFLCADFQKIPPALNPGGFDYAVFMRRKGVSVSAYVASGKWKLCAEKAAFSVSRLADQSRKKILQIYRSFGLGQNEYAVLAALTLGYKDEIDPELRASFGDSGAMHILAVSGLHVGVIYLVLNFVFSLIFKKKILRCVAAVLILSFLWVYAFVTGLSPSVMRSALMFSLVVLADVLRRKSQVYNTVFFSAFVLLLIDPGYLYDPGFLLSYAAVLSILYFQPLIKRCMGFENRMMQWLWEVCSVSLAAQLGTLPLALFCFHRFPNYFLLTNVVAIPLASIIIYTSIMALMLFPVPFLISIFTFCLQFLLSALNKSMTFIQGLPFSVSDVYIDQWQTLLLGLALILFVFYIEKRRAYTLLLMLSMLFCVVSGDLVRQYETLRSSSLVVFADRKDIFVCFARGKSNVLLTTNDHLIANDVNNYLIRRKLNSPDTVCVAASCSWLFENKRGALLLDDGSARSIMRQNVKIDYLIVGKRLKTDPAVLFGDVLPGMCIVGQGVSGGYAGRLKDFCKKNGVCFYNIGEQGAFISDDNKPGSE